MSVNPVNGSSWAVGATGGGARIRFEIPLGNRNEFHDYSMSYLKFKLTNTTVDNVAADKLMNLGGGVAGIIRRLEVWHNSNPLESINEYHRLYYSLVDINMNAADRLESSTFEGGSDVNVRQGVGFAAAGDAVFCLPVMSGVLGQQLDKYMPVGLMSGKLILELELEDANTALVSALATDVLGYTISEVEYMINVVKLDESITQSIEQQMIANGGFLYLHGESYRMTSKNVPANAAASSITETIGANFASLKTIYAGLFNNAIRTTNTSFSITGRNKGTLTQYQWQIGDMYLPAKAVVVPALASEAYHELLKGFHAIGYSLGGSMSTAEYNLLTDGANANNGAFLIAIDTEAVARKGALLSSGLNTTSQSVVFRADFGAGMTSDTIVFYSHFDHILVLDETGSMTVRF